MPLAETNKTRTNALRLNLRELHPSRAASFYPKTKNTSHMPFRNEVTLYLEACMHQIALRFMFCDETLLLQEFHADALQRLVFANC